MDLLPTFRGAPVAFRTAASWMRSSEIPLSVGFASARRLMLLGFYTMVLSEHRLAFIVTTEAEALQELARASAGPLIATQQLERGSGLALVEQARSLVNDIPTILILDGPHDDLVAAGRSTADAMLCDVDCFADSQPLVSMFRSHLRPQQPIRPQASRPDPCGSRGRWLGQSIAQPPRVARAQPEQIVEHWRHPAPQRCGECARPSAPSTLNRTAFPTAPLTTATPPRWHAKRFLMSPG